MLSRTRSHSFAVNGALTRAVQFAGWSTGQGDNRALIASSPLSLDHRLPQRNGDRCSFTPPGAPRPWPKCATGTGCASAPAFTGWRGHADWNGCASGPPKDCSKMARARRPSSLTPMGIYDIVVPTLRTRTVPCKLRGVIPFGRIATGPFNQRCTKIARAERLRPSPPSCNLRSKCP